ncbi:hypothetical protein CPJCM30710_15880 [Clostridium polyendosporum]|uniref:GerMN domain-containing protein n=1 Tax=Clostridium polyendosporum TaxID=69208 RepID=A0A919VG82_9CLOT|nr:GerMN domain-containing protein [Clostridium polyendosporum]GIM28922.1 hypothetical protein CPJCM30710_15880 [Clostridium polyendosporum]
MKKFVIIIFFMVILMFPNTALAATSTAKDYFPMKPNTVFVYQGYGNEFSSYIRYTDYTNSTRQQLRINNGGTETVNVYEYTFYGVRIRYTNNECYYRENFLNKTANKSEYLIKNPIKKGTTWTLADGSKRSITNTNATMKTTLKTYTGALEVTTTRGTSKTKDYYVKGVGLVKSIHYLEGGYTVMSSLKQIKTNTPLIQIIRFYYPDSNINKVWYVDKKISFYTNDITRSKIVKEFRNPPKGLVPCIGANTTSNWLYYNTISKMVYVDFSANFVKDLNAGSTYESLCLTSIVNTIGGYYNINKVYLTLAGKPYESGHILKKPGEPFITNFNGIGKWPN